MSQRTSHAQECPKTTEELLDLLIREGIASVERNETLAERIRAAKAGFELCRLLHTPRHFHKLIQERHQQERIYREKVDTIEYWEYRYATIRVEWVWERMKIAWNLPGPYSAQAVLDYLKLTTVEEA